MIKTRAIVLHRFPYSDSSWIVKVLAEESGIVSFIVKGGKRKDSPFKGALDPLSLSEIVYRENPNAELQFLKEASVIEWHPHLRENLLDSAKAQVMTEIVLRYAPAGVSPCWKTRSGNSILRAILPNKAPQVYRRNKMSQIILLGKMPRPPYPQATHPAFSPAGF